MSITYPRREVEPGMGSDVGDEKETPHPGDSSDAKAVHRFDKTSFRQDLGKRECSCDGCACRNTTVCLGKKCKCCTVSG